MGRTQIVLGGMVVGDETAELQAALRTEIESRATASRSVPRLDRMPLRHQTSLASAVGTSVDHCDLSTRPDVPVGGKG